MDTALYIDTLLREQAATALSALKTPRNRDGFEFGHACGMVQGLERALALLNELAEDADGRARKSKPPAYKGNPYLEELDAAPHLPEQYQSVKHTGSPY
jgi:hypothetical protein